MEITFKNLDKDYRKGQRELIGDIQPKFWYHGKTDRASGNVLVKRQSSQNVGKNRPRSKMYNHVGEYFGYLLAQKAEVKACPVDLVTMHDTKNKYSNRIMIFTGCASHSLKKPRTSLIPGEGILGMYAVRNDEEVREVLKQTNRSESLYSGTILSQAQEDNVDIVLAAIIRETVDFESKLGKRSKDEIKDDVKQNLQDAIDMIVYDCVFGNHDRHSGNWAMEMDSETGKISLYPAYDNEAVLGLRRPEAEIRDAVSRPDVMPSVTDDILSSRMGFGKRNSGILYKDMLNYLVEKYPEFAISSIEKITSLVDENYVDSLYDSIKGISTRGEFSDELTEIDELPTAYRIFGMSAFCARRDYARSLITRRKNESERSSSSEITKPKSSNEELSERA